MNRDNHGHHDRRGKQNIESANSKRHGKYHAYKKTKRKQRQKPLQKDK